VARHSTLDSSELPVSRRRANPHQNSNKCASGQGCCLTKRGATRRVASKYSGIKVGLSRLRCALPRASGRLMSGKVIFTARGCELFDEVHTLTARSSNASAERLIADFGTLIASAETSIASAETLIASAEVHSRARMNLARAREMFSRAFGNLARAREVHWRARMAFSRARECLRRAREVSNVKRICLCWCNLCLVGADGSPWHACCSRRATRPPLGASNAGPRRERVRADRAREGRSLVREAEPCSGERASAVRTLPHGGGAPCASCSACILRPCCTKFSRR